LVFDDERRRFFIISPVSSGREAAYKHAGRFLLEVGKNFKAGPSGQRSKTAKAAAYRADLYDTFSEASRAREARLAAMLERRAARQQAAS
jgi:hypothetical protein